MKQLLSILSAAMAAVAVGRAVRGLVSLLLAVFTIAHAPGDAPATGPAPPASYSTAAK